MGWGIVRRLIDAVSEERVRTLSDEIADIREEVLFNKKRIGNLQRDLEQKVSQMENWKDEKDENINSNARAIEHVVEAMQHGLESTKVDIGSAKVSELEERISKLEKALKAEKIDVETSRRPTKRTTKRPNDENGRPSDLVDTAENAKQGEMLWNKATPAQQTVIKSMYDAGYPMSYKEIADEVGRSISTVKNHINNLKAAGFDFKEDSGHNNAKKYMLDERVKAFLTLRLNK